MTMQYDYAARWGYVFDRTNQADIDEAKRITHDTLIADLGNTRRSGVSWFLWTPAEATLNLLAAGTELPPDIAEQATEHPAGLVILALAAAER